MENYNNLSIILECENSTYDEIKYDKRYLRKLCEEFCGNQKAATGLCNALKREGGIRCIEDLRTTPIEEIEQFKYFGKERIECVKNMKGFLE